MNVVMNVWVPSSVGNFLTSLGNVSFLRRTVLHGAGCVVGYWIELLNCNCFTEEIYPLYETSMFITVFTTFYHWTLSLTRNEKLKTSKVKGKGKVIPLQACYRFWGLQQVEAPRFEDSRHMKMDSLAAVGTVRLYLAGDIPGTHFC